MSTGVCTSEITNLCLCSHNASLMGVNISLWMMLIIGLRLIIIWYLAFLIWDRMGVSKNAQGAFLLVQKKRTKFCAFCMVVHATYCSDLETTTLTYAY